MTPATARWIRLGISSLIAGLVAMGGALLTAGGKGGAITKQSVLLAFITGVVVAGNDVKSYLSTPPTV